MADLNALKKMVFFEMLEFAGRVFIHVEHSDDVIIGRRGFLNEEKEKGIILVVNSRMNFSWDSSGLSAKLVFGTSVEECFIPPEAIISVFSPEMQAQFTAAIQKESPKTATPSEQNGNRKNEKVVEIDFKSKRAKKPKQ